MLNRGTMFFLPGLVARRRLIPALLALAFLAASGLVAWHSVQAATDIEEFAISPSRIGGEFTLTDHKGHQAWLSQFKGKVVLMSFGYTHCPDVCPTTLVEFKRVKGKLGDQASRLVVLFITMDPARDTPEVLDGYMPHFDPEFIGLTGNQNEVDLVAEKFMARYEYRPADKRGDYTVGHTTLIYLMDHEGKVRYIFPFQTKADTISVAAKKLIAAVP